MPVYVSVSAVNRGGLSVMYHHLEGFLPISQCGPVSAGGGAWEWRGSGVGVAREWRGSGVGVAWEWRGSGVGVAREWRAGGGQQPAT